ncbi:vitamin K epoxide reductase family protein [Naasia sp. SYSU D00948]|uniref:vitamin K epoxide reductase family protein n=1 Tax=Naasia sp. SYSU D00948 TaxID=2817379 RepID=UPI001B303CFE|nr:vitamin K epoxide reductase family protein [Naasia sp. SYSU D00948]
MTAQTPARERPAEPGEAEARGAEARLVPVRGPVAIAILFIVTGLVGLYGSFQLTIERFALITNPDVPLSCDINPFVSCGPVIQSWQGSLFGFPNPMIGMMAFVAPVAVGVAMLAGARFARWFWILFNLGLLAAVVFIHWLMTQTVFVIGTLCPYCMLVWLATIPLFWYGTVYNLGHNLGLPEGAASLFRQALKWTWLLVLLNYLVIVAIILVNFPLLPTVLFG